MKQIKINFKNITEKQIDLVVDYLNRGEIIVYPTDTIYGLGCLATKKKAINRIYKIKKRSKSKPLLILVSSLTMLKEYCYVSKRQYEHLKAIWPGSVSAIFRSKDLLPPELTGGGDSVAVRFPKNDFLVKLIKRVGVPIVSTSVNVSGQKSITGLRDLENYFKTHKPDLIIDAGELKGKPSKLIDVRDINNIKVLRK